MKKRFENNWFAFLYVWMALAKYTMGMLFIISVMLYLFFGYICSSAAVLDIFTALGMAAAGLLTGVLRQALIGGDQFSASRSIIWVTAGTAVISGFSLIFEWFDGFPVWCSFVFAAIQAAAMAGMVLGFYLQLYHESEKLNKHLKNFRFTEQADSENKTEEN